MKILAIGAHFDDVELGCGGTLLKHNEKGDEISLLVVTDSGYKELSGRERKSSDAFLEAKRAADFIDADLYCLDMPALNLRLTSEIIFNIQKVILKVKPDWILTHFPYDQHSDHSVVGNASVVLSRFTKRMTFYRSNFHPTIQPFISNYIVNISEYIDSKKELISFYESEQEKVKHWIQIFEMDAKSEGLKYNFNYAESFMDFINKDC